VDDICGRIQEGQGDERQDQIPGAKDQQTAEFTKKQKDGAQAALGRLTQAGATGTMSSVFKEWVNLVTTAKNAAEIDELMKSSNGKMKSFKDKTKVGAKKRFAAHSLASRANDLPRRLHLVETGLEV